MSEIIGDTSHLHQNTIEFNAVHELLGHSGVTHFPLVECQGLRGLLASRASVTIVSDSLRCQILAPPSADQAAVAQVAVVPSTCPSWPGSGTDILTVGGSVFVQHSLYTGALAVDLRFAPEVAHQIKPAPVVGSPPEVVVAYTVAGADATTVSRLRISGRIRVDGIGFVSSW